jgi:hypothetical protein
MQTRIKISQIAAIAASALVCAFLLIAVWRFADLRILVVLPIAASPAIFFIYNSRLRNAERKIEADAQPKPCRNASDDFARSIMPGTVLTGPKVSGFASTDRCVKCLVIRKKNC